MPNLPVSRLSLSSINTLRKCPYKWRRKYIDGDRDPGSGKMLLGKVFGAAEAQSDYEWIETGAPLDSDAVLDAYSDEFEYAAGQDVDWQGEQPAAMKDSGALALRIYHTQVPDQSPPVEAEREVSITVEDVGFVSYLDVEREDGSVEDRKLIGRKMTQEQADSDPQVDAYLAGRRAEGNPAPRFVFDTAVRTKNPYSERIETTRTDEQLDRFLLDILGAAEEIEWRSEADNWSFAPAAAWWCGQGQCGFWDSCPAGGLLRKRAAQIVRNGGNR